MSIERIIPYIARIITFMLVTPLHESAHGWMAKQLGDDTAEREGRITLNPFAHLDPMGTILLVFTGFGWATPVPVNPLLFKRENKNGKRVSLRGGMALTAAAGPISNIIAALAVGLAYNIMLCLDLEYTNLVRTIYLLFASLFRVNVGLAIFNLIPIPPLDGSHILRYFANDKINRWMQQNMEYLTKGFFAFMLISTWVPQIAMPISWATNAVSDLLWHAVSWIPAVFG